MTDVVISYAREDRGIARRIADCLGRYGFTVTWDRDTAARSRFVSDVEDSRATFPAVVVLWSRHSIRNRSVMDEAVRAEKRQALFPVLVETIEEPPAFRHRQHTDLVGWSGDERSTEFSSLLHHLNQHLARQSAFQGMITVIESAGATSLTPMQRSITPNAPQLRGLGTKSSGNRSSIRGLVAGASLLVGAIGVVVVHLLPGEVESRRASSNQAGPAVAVPAVSMAVSTGPLERTKDTRALVRLWPDEHAASSERISGAERHPVSAAFDGDRQSAWMSYSTRERSPEWIEAQFAQPVHVHHIVVYNGYQLTTSHRKSLFSKHPRAKVIEVAIDDDSTAIATIEFARADQTPVSITLQRAARTVRLTIAGTWPPDGAAEGRSGDVSISEIELWGSHLY